MGRTPLDDYAARKLRDYEKSVKMQRDLDKYGKKTATGGRVWTVGDMQRFFKDTLEKKRRRR